MDWREIPGFPAYEISDTGIVKRVKPPSARRVGSYPKVIKPSYTGKKPHRLQSVMIQDADGAFRTKIVSTLVAMTFLGPRPSPRHSPMHRDGNRDNHAVNNLFWGERPKLQRRNVASARAGRSLTADDVLAIRARFTHRRGQLGVLAKEFGTTPQNIHLITSGQRWAHLTAQ
jgi:hypothetical protein